MGSQSTQLTTQWKTKITQKEGNKMNKEEQLIKLEEGKKLPHAKIEDFKQIPKGVSKEEFSDYIKQFLKPQRKCWLCGHDLYVNWGIQHGEAFCINCNIGSRVYHYFKDEAGNKIRFEASLQYHPSNYSLDNEEEN